MIKNNVSRVLALGLVFSASIALMSLNACSKQSGPQVSKENTFTLRLTAEPATLDWNRAHTTVETYLLMNLMEGLLEFDSDLKIRPALAEKFEKSTDGKVYTFTLKPGVKWSDGVALKAQDFAYSWQRLLDPKTAASYAYFLFDVEGAESFNKGELKDFSKVGVKALSDSVLQVTLIKPVAHWAYIPTFWVTYPMRQDVVEKFGEAWVKPGNMVTLGAYTLAAQETESKVILKANPTYYGSPQDAQNAPQGKVLEIDGLIIKDDSTALTLYESGKLDFLGDLPPMDLVRLEKHPELKVFPYLKTAYMGFSINRPEVNKAEFRRAIAMAIDKSRLSEVLHGRQVKATSFVPPQMLGHSEQVGLPFDLEKAKAELKASGFLKAAQGAGEPAVKIELITANWEKSLTLAQFIQGELKKNLGIEIGVQPYDHKTFRAQLKLNQSALFSGSWSADFPDPDNFLSLWMSDSGNNRTTWKNKEYDAAILLGRTLPPGPDQVQKREQIYLKAQKLLLEKDAVIVPLYYEPNLALVRARVQGLRLDPLNGLQLKKVQLVK